MNKNVCVIILGPIVSASFEALFEAGTAANHVGMGTQPNMFSSLEEGRRMSVEFFSHRKKSACVSVLGGGLSAPKSHNRNR